MAEPVKPTERAGGASKLWVAGLVVVLLWLAWALSRDIHRPWINYADFNGAVWSQSAHNNLRAGWRTTWGVPTGFHFGPLPIPPRGYYTHHPPLLPWLVTAAFAVFGEHEWAARVVPVSFSLLTAVLLWWLVRSCVNARAATLAVAVLAALPMELHFAPMVNHEPLVLLWMIGMLVCLRQAQLTSQGRWVAGLCGCAFLGMWTGWHTYMFAVPLGFVLLMRPSRLEKQAGLGLLALAVLSAVLFLLHIRLGRPDAWQDLLAALRFRLSSTDQAGMGYPWSQWAAKVGGSLWTTIPAAAWLLAAGGFLQLFRTEGMRWLAWASAGIFLVTACYVVGFRNASYIHAYAPFYFIGPVAMLSGVALDGFLRRTKAHPGGNPLLPPVRAAGVLFIILSLAVAGQATARSLDRQQHCILDWQTAEAPDLVPRLGEAIRREFPEDTLVLCNFMPAYGPHLYYYAQRTLWNNLSTFEQWQPILNDPQLPIGGVVWLGHPDARSLLSHLPPGNRREVTVSNHRFCFWLPAGRT
ncbi:glycosyltransferase family 39 protein [bacterium]|nr:glycosyltransferase family 39 protein [bacterium]